MIDRPTLSLSTVVLDCADAHELSEFYRQLLSWDVKASEPGWVLLGPRGGGTGLSFEAESWYRAPVWPEQAGEPHKMLHLDIEVDDLEAAGALALSLGAILADYQPQEKVRVYFDPAGHPFCLWTT